MYTKYLLAKTKTHCGGGSVIYSDNGTYFVQLATSDRNFKTRYIMRK